MSTYRSSNNPQRLAPNSNDISMLRARLEALLVLVERLTTVNKKLHDAAAAYVSAGDCGYSNPHYRDPLEAALAEQSGSEL